MDKNEPQAKSKYILEPSLITMKLKFTSALLAASVLALSPVFAQDAMTPSTAEPIYTWTGFYVGIQGGGAFNTGDNGGLVFDNNLDGNYDNSIAAFGNNFDGSFDSSGSYGLHAGYDFQVNRWVFGALADINAVSIRQRQSGFSSTPAFYTEERNIDTLGTVRARAGYLVTDRLLGYVTGGVAYADVGYRMLTNTPAATATSGGGDDMGYVYGAGFETRITSRISVGVEYLYYNLGDGDFRSNFSGPAAFSTVAASTNARGSDRDFDFSQVQAKLTYRF